MNKLGMHTVYVVFIAGWKGDETAGKKIWAKLEY